MREHGVRAFGAPSSLVLAIPALLLANCVASEGKIEPLGGHGGGASVLTGGGAAARGGAVAVGPAPSTPSTPSTPQAPEVPARCGDGVKDAGEECDGTPTCSGECREVACGDGRKDDGEECDPPRAGECSERCRAIVCGNERRDQGEECEPPGVGRCGKKCLNIECGNGRLDDGEDCDPPEAGKCSNKCKAIACGNGIVDEGEGCDPPSPGSCDATCHPNGCGNGSLGPGEECDPPVPGKCGGSCLDIVCGNSRVDDGEDCDPPVAGSCNDQCKSTSCGNAIVDAGEQCDPPVPGQCSSQCQTTRCGDGRVDEGEDCEPSGSNDPSCTASCLSTTSAGGKTYLFTFDSDVQGFELYSTEPASLKSSASLGFDSSNGEVTPGALKIEVPFNGQNQRADFQVSFPSPTDLRGKTVRARVKLVSGLSSDASNPGGIKMFAKSGDEWDYASGQPVTLTQGAGFVDVTFVADSPVYDPDGFDAQLVRQIGFELRTFGGRSTSAATVLIDAIGL
jgi:hypothetical protein